MDVVIVGLWQVVVDNTGQGVNVNTTRGHIGSDENIGATRDNGGEGLFTLSLGAVTVNSNGFDAALLELVSQTVGTVLGLAKDDGTAVLGNEGSHSLDAVVLARYPEVVVHFGWGGVANDVVDGGVVGELFNEGANF